MKKNMFFHFILCILLSSIAGCREDNNVSTKDEFDLKKINYQTHYTNPYDTIGKYHNEALAYVFNEYFKSPKARSSYDEKEKLNTLIVDFFNKKPFVEGIKVTEDNLQQFELQLQAKSSDKRLFASNKQQEYYNRLKDLVEKEKHSSPQDFISSINKLEKQVSESDLSESEQAQLLMGMSVAKYSSIFWVEQVQKMHVQAKTAKAPPVEMYDGNWNYWFSEFLNVANSVFWADVEGGIQGFVTAFIFIDHSGPLAAGFGVATIKAIMTLTVACAVGNSVWNGIKIVWNLLFEIDDEE